MARSTPSSKLICKARQWGSDVQDRLKSYDAFASEYAGLVAAREATGIENDPIMPRFLHLLGDVSGLTVLDAGCGEGYLARILAQQGAHVTGIDLAPRLIEMARAKDPAGQIAYQVADLSQPLPAYRDHFDLIVGHFVLNDVFDYRGFLTTLGAVARHGGRLIFSLDNPYSFVVRGHSSDYFDSDKVVSYRGMAAKGVKVHFYQRTLEEYLDAGFMAGLQLQRLVDIPTPEGSFSRQSGMLIPEGCDTLLGMNPRSF